MPRKKKVSSPTREPNADEKFITSRVIGQDHVAPEILPFVDLYRVGLSSEGRPAGVFLLLGPTGTGKTHTVESIAELIHGSRRNVLRIDCGEYQMEHEVAKLIGAPPGYLGHRETQPVLTQVKLNQVMSDRANLAIVLFDEIEKAAPSLQRILLGILDRGILRLGDNTPVNFERTLIFFTSNLGAEAMQKEAAAPLGLGRFVDAGPAADPARHSLSAAARAFSPEFLNRIDRQIVYNFLHDPELEKILDLELQNIDLHFQRRLGSNAPHGIVVTPPARKLILGDGYDPRYGARHIKRSIHQRILFPLAKLLKVRPYLGDSNLVVSDHNGEVVLGLETAWKAAEVTA